jgi:branched-chain amino acid transport system ATP-binding protein
LVAEQAPCLEVTDLRAGYGEIEVLRGLSLAARQGQIVSIIGANGAGKSTLLKTIFGIVRPTDGAVRFEGQVISGLSPLHILRKGITYVPEGRANFPAMTVQENLEMGAYTRSDSRQVRAEIDALCQRFTILREKRHTPAGNLSGGQQQMVELAIALMLRPRVMLIDEPTLGLAPILVKEVFAIIQEINASGTTILLVEQNARRALEISHYGYVLELGRIRFEGTPDLLMHNEEVHRAYLGER